MRRVRGMRPLHVENGGTLWAGRGLKVYRSRDRGENWECVASGRGGFFQMMSRASRLFERFTRSGLQGLCPLSDTEFLATARGAILKGNIDTKVLRPVFTIRRGSCPMNLCCIPDGRIYWGEYWFNQDRAAVHIYASEDDGEHWNIAFTFPPGDIRHIHGLYYDPSRDGCWILTGDDDKESGVFFADKDFQNVQSVFRGAQQFRSISLVPNDDYLLTGTDSPFEFNYIQLLYPDTGKCEKVQRVDGSIFDVRRIGNFYVVSVMSEPSHVNTSPYASLWISRDGKGWQEYFKIRRDIWQMPYNPIIPDHIAELPIFQHASLVLPSGQNEKNVLYAYGQAVRKHDGHMLVWDL